MNLKLNRVAVAIAVTAVSAAVIAATLIQLDAPVVVSTADVANNASKAKMGWISYKSDVAQANYDVKAQLLVYADGPAGAQNIYVARSTDNGATWTEQPMTNSGGSALKIGAYSFSITHNKPNIFVAPTGAISGGAGANALVTYTSSDCEASPAQGVNANLLTGTQPYMCLWAARSLDGGLSWARQRLTDGSMDPDDDVPAGYTKSDLSAGGFAISFQADPAGLQQGDAEGPGDGASGAKVSAGTNIWYTYINKANFENGAAFPAPVQVSDNNSSTIGAAGASRANLSISGGTTVLAYEETKGDGTNGKHIVYHSFPYATPDTNSAGTVVSDPAKNARRVRFALQGNEALDPRPAGDGDGDAADGDTQGVHVLLMWRETASLEPAAASDIMVRRGIKNTALRPGSTGFLASDVVADTPVNVSDTGLTDNALAHRALLRGDFLAVAYDHTPDKAAADAFTGTYNLFVRRSTDGGNSWGAVRNMTQLADASTRVVEPRLVGTPGTITLPDGSATGDASEVQNRNVFYVGWGTETNEAVGKPLDLFVTRTTDQGLNYERVQLLADGATEQSEMQLRSPPDGKTLGALWMQRDATAGTVDVIYRNGNETVVADTDLSLTATGTSFATGAQGQVTFTVLNKGAGDARRVLLQGAAPSGLTILALSEPALCSVSGAQFSCALPELLPGQSRAISLTLASVAAGTYELATRVSGDVLDADTSDNSATATVAVLSATASGGGGCAAATGLAPFDPLLLALAALGLIGLGARRWCRSHDQS